MRFWLFHPIPESLPPKRLDDGNISEPLLRTIRTPPEPGFMEGRLEFSFEVVWGLWMYASLLYYNSHGTTPRHLVIYIPHIIFNDLS